MKRPALVLLPLAFVAVVAASAAADEPAPMPERQAFTSPNGRFRLEIVRFSGKSSSVKKPTASGFSETREYFGAEAKTRAAVETDKAGRALKVRLTTEPFASRSVHQMRLFETGKEAPLWEAGLEYMPAAALVSDSGRHVALFDHFGSIGNTREVVALWGEGGRRERSYALADLLTHEEEARVPHAAANVLWAAASEQVPHRFDAAEANLVLSLAPGSAAPDQPQPPPQTRQIVLATGKVRP
jgi:hypothetical protein